MENKSRHGSDRSQWEGIASSARYKDLLAAKKAFIVPAFIFFFIYYFSLLVFVGYAPKMMSLRIWGTVNLAYLFALSQFLVGWVIAWRYLKASAKFDLLAKDILRAVQEEQGDE